MSCVGWRIESHESLPHFQFKQRIYWPNFDLSFFAMVQMHSRPFVVTSSPGDKRVFHRYEEENLYAFEPLDGLGKSEPLDYTMSEFGSSAPIEEPHENDVLMGRGGKNNQHSGNEKLREVARSHCEQYRVSTKKGKSYISRQLVQYMRELTPPARYVRMLLGYLAVG